MANEKGTEIETKISNDALAEITSFDDALALLTEVYGENAVAVASEVMGDGFAMLTDKDKLIGVAFVAVSWNFSIGDHGEFVAMKVVTVENKKLIVIDGSTTGICAQMSEYSAKTGKYHGLVVKNGLRRSDYTYTDEQGKETPATTYYLDLTA